MIKIFKLKIFVNRLFKLTIICASLPSLAQADFYLHTWEDHFSTPEASHFGLDTSYYSSSRNYQSPLSSLSSGTLQQYQRIQTDILLSKGITERLSLYGRFSWAYIDVDSTLRSGSGYGLTDQSFGVAYQIYRNEKNTASKLGFFSSPLTSLNAQIQVDVPFYSNQSSEDQKKPYLGDGTVDVTPGLFATVPIYTQKTRQLYATLGGGLTLRSHQFSTAIPWSALFKYSPIAEGIFIELGALGFMSLKTDPHSTQNSTPLFHSNSGSGGSLITGSINPSLLQFRAQLGYQSDTGSEVSATLLQSLWGQAAPQSLNLMIQVQFPFESPSKKEDPLQLNPIEYGKANRGFLSYSLDAKVLKVNDRMNLVKINKGSQDGINTGDVFDIFSVRKDGSIGVSIARGLASSVRLEEAAIDITEFFKEVWIEEGFLAKRLIH